MKRLFLSLLLTATVLGAAVFELIYVGRQSDAYTEKIHRIDTLLADGDTDGAVRVCRETEREWDSEVGRIYILLIHDYADNVGGSIAKMRAHLENGNRDMYAAESAGAKKALASIKGSEYPLPENIL